MNVTPIEPPERFLDPVTYALMVDPVKCSDGRTYDRSTAERLTVSPFTRTPLAIRVDDVTIRGEIFGAYPDQERAYREIRPVQVPTQAALPDPTITELSHLILRGLEAGRPPQLPEEAALPRATMASWVLLGASGAAALKTFVELKVKEPISYPQKPADFESWFAPNGVFTNEAEYVCGLFFDGKPLEQRWGFLGCSPDPRACRNLLTVNDCETPVPDPLYGSSREQACLTAQSKCTHQNLERALKAEAYYHELVLLEPAQAYNKAISIGADAAAGISVAVGVLVACRIYLKARGNRSHN